jgi:L-alanine-DL-glutamate epimerase-like enolase superfamily enzyme
VVDVAMAQLAATLSGMDNECEAGEFQALEGDPTIGARIENGWLKLNREPGWGLRLTA